MNLEIWREANRSRITNPDAKKESSDRVSFQQSLQPGFEILANDVKLDTVTANLEWDD